MISREGPLFSGELGTSSFAPILNNERVLLAVSVEKFTFFDFKVERGIVLTSMALYRLNDQQVRARVPLNEIEGMTLPNEGEEFLIHLGQTGDQRLSGEKSRAKLLEWLEYLAQKGKAAKDGFSVWQVDSNILKNFTRSHSEAKNKISPKLPTTALLRTVDCTNYQSKISVINKPIDLKLCNLTTKGQLGRGGYGTIYWVVDNISKTDYAIKVISKQNIEDKEHFNKLLIERSVLRLPPNPFVLSLIQTFNTDNNVCILLPLMKGGDLFNFSLNQKDIPEAALQFIAASITLGLQHLHKHNFLYRDLKPENVMLSDKGNIMLTDFGTCRRLSSNGLGSRTMIGSPAFLAPEILSDQEYSYPVDWWSLGVLLYELHFGCLPFKGNSMDHLFEQIKKTKIEYPQNKSTSQELKNLLNGLLCKNPEKRIGSTGDAKEILGHPWFKKIDLSALVSEKLKLSRWIDLPSSKNWLSNFKEFVKEKNPDILFSSISGANTGIYQSEYFPFE